MCGAGTDVADNRVKGLASAKKTLNKKQHGCSQNANTQVLK